MAVAPLQIARHGATTEH